MCYNEELAEQDGCDVPTGWRRLQCVDESAARWAGARAGRWGTELVWEWESVTSDGI